MKQPGESLAGRIGVLAMTPMGSTELIYRSWGSVASVRLRKLSTMLTHVHGGLLNVSDLARSLDLSVPSGALRCALGAIESGGFPRA